jgi:hypothetical protein
MPLPNSVVIQGARFPEININNAKKLFDWLMLDAKLIRVWGCVSVAIDVCVCILRESTIFPRKLAHPYHSGVPILEDEGEHVSHRASVDEQASCSSL